MKRFFYPVLAFLAIASLWSCEKEILNDVANIVLVESEINTATTWVKSKVYVVENSVTVNANLTIEPGTTIKFKSGAWIAFGGYENVTLTANGTEEEPIIFTSYSTTPSAGAWQGIWLEGHTLSNSSMTFCEIRYAGQDNLSALNVDVKITFNDNKILNAKKIGISSAEGFVSFNGNTIENVGNHAIEIPCKSLHTLGDNNSITCNDGYGIKVEGGDLEGTNITWKKQAVPFYIPSGIWVDQTLTIEPGTILKFNADGWLSFGSINSATLLAIGTEEKPILFTSAASTPAPGAWSGLFFESNTTSNSKMIHCTVEYAGKENNNANITILHANGLTIENCLIRNSSGYGVYSYNSSWNNINNIFTNNSLDDVFTE